LFPALAGTLAVILFGSPAVAQNQPPSPPPAAAQVAAPLTPEQLDQLTAPIALYPDPLVGQILMAATYPLEVVEADRWLQQRGNAALKGDQLAAALAQQPWDPSVKSLVAFPQILKMMDGNLTWTEQLGDAFLAAQSAVMDSVQRLRQQAEAAGKLKSTSQMVVSTVDGIIVIAPPDPNSVYVPVYNPNDIYGAWAYPDYPPDYFPGYFPGVEIGPLGFGWLDVAVVAPLWGWDSSDWRDHRINIDANRFTVLNRNQPAIASGAWQHDPSHRGGVQYRDPAVRARFQGAVTTAAARGARGFPAAAPQAGPAVNATRPTAAAARPPSPQNERAPQAAGRAAPQNERGPAASGARAPSPQNERVPATAAARTPSPQTERAPTAAVPARAPAPQIARAPTPAAARAPVVLRPAPPVVQSFGPGPQVRAEAQRGQASRASAPAPRAAAAAPAPRAAAPPPAPRAAAPPPAPRAAAPPPAPRATAPAPRAAPAPQGKGEHK
jgi:hypothetical protein